MSLTLSCRRRAGEEPQRLRVVGDEQALRLAPDYVDAHFNLAMALLKLGRPAEARHELQMVLRLPPGDGEARRILASLHETNPAAPPGR